MENDQQFEQNPLPQISPPSTIQAQQQKPLTAEEARQELTQAIHGSTAILVRATTALKIFSDTIIVDRAKLTVTKRTFWKTAEVVSIRIEDILNVTSTVGPVLGSIKITSRIMNNEKPYEITGFWREDAQRMKRITQGYVIALQRGIDCSALSDRELIVLLDKLGVDSHQ